MYWAFISYSSKDQKTASWLHRRLENYRIPKEFIGEPVEDKDTAIGKHLRPIFRDRDELSGSDELSTDIQKALKRSRNLIVLCSPNSASSRWVNKEIEDYRSLQPSGKILPIIVEGEPNSKSPTRECFPPALRLPNEPLASDFRKNGDGKERGVIKIVSAILNTSFDKLYQRHERRIRRVRLFLGISSTLLALVFASIAIFAWYQKDIAEEQTRFSETQLKALSEYATPFLDQRKAEFQKNIDSYYDNIPPEHRRLEVGLADRSDYQEQISVLDNMVNKDSKYHPMPAMHWRQLGASNDYTEMYLFPCCNTRVITSNNAPSQFRLDGCEASPYSKEGQKDFISWLKSFASANKPNAEIVKSDLIGHIIHGYIDDYSASWSLDSVSEFERITLFKELESDVFIEFTADVLLKDSKGSYSAKLDITYNLVDEKWVLKRVESNDTLKLID